MISSAAGGAYWPGVVGCAWVHGGVGWGGGGLAFLLDFLGPH